MFTGRKSTLALESNVPFDKSSDSKQGEEKELKVRSLVTLPNENIEKETESAKT